MNRPLPIPGFETGNDFFEIGLMAAASADFAAAMSQRIAEASVLVAVAADADHRDEHCRGGEQA